MANELIVGTDGSVTWTTLGSNTSFVSSFACSIEAAEVENGPVSFCPCSVDWGKAESIAEVLARIEELQGPIHADKRLQFDADGLRRAILCNWNIYSGRARLCLLSCFVRRGGLLRQRELVAQLDLAKVARKVRDEEDVEALAFFLRTILWP